MDTTHSRRGFTLLEILVATAVILLLIAILLSSLEQSQTRAKSTVCLANLRSIGTAMRLYQEDARGWLPVGPADKVWYVDRMIGLVREPAPGRRPYPWTNCHWGGQASRLDPHHSERPARTRNPGTAADPISLPGHRAGSADSVVRMPQ